MTVAHSARIFGGPAYSPRLDGARLSLQIEQIKAWAFHVEWFSLREAKDQLERLYAPALFPESSVSAQLRNLKKRPYRCVLAKQRRKGAQGRGSGIWEYRLWPPATEIADRNSSADKIKFPATFDELEAAGYGYTGTAKECDCGKMFLWFITPAGKWMPLTSIEGLRLVPHHVVCENLKQSRAANANRVDQPDPRTLQAALF